MSTHTDKYWQKCREEQNKRVPLGPLNPGLHFPPEYLHHLQNLEECLRNEFDEKIKEIKSQKQIQELAITLQQVQHENKNLRDELQYLRATLLEVLDALTANASGSPKDGPCANSSSA